MEKATASFGFTEVPIQEKQARVRGVFESVASNYDIMNDVMSGGLHRLWKSHFVAQLPVRDGATLLDLAGGTGDISFRYLTRAKEKDVNAKAIISDINAAMLAEGQKRALNENRHALGEIEFKEINAEAIPLPDHSIDAVTIAFGIRNVTHIDKALKEIYRVLKPGCPFYCLEFSPVETPVVRELYDAFSFHLIPKMGQLIANDRDSYQYLVESIRRFPTADDFAEMIESAGFERVSYEKLSAEIVAIHKGWKI
jgi:demethylmenaquinone methyltransferase/2-methoxy-6-polyprenyl-1,4-benzoquinol methylase